MLRTHCDCCDKAIDATDRVVINIEVDIRGDLFRLSNLKNNVSMDLCELCSLRVDTALVPPPEWRPA